VIGILSKPNANGLESEGSYIFRNLILYPLTAFVNMIKLNRMM